MKIEWHCFNRVDDNTVKFVAGAIDGQILSGEYFLEIPSSNKSFFEGSQRFKDLATDYKVTIKYLDE